MKQLSFKLEIKDEIFNGPLDLMLSLISKNKLDIEDIEISVLLKQFLNYINEMQENDIEITGEFLEMAAKLIYIKTVSLLPKYEIEQLKKELEGALIEYALCKTTAERLRNYYIGDTIFTRNPAEIEIDLTYNLSHSLNELIESVCVVSERDKLRAEPVFSHPLTEVKIEYVSVFSKTLYILKRLRKGGKLELNGLFSDLKRSGKVAMFMALLELSSNGRIAFSQELDYIEFIKK